MGIRVTASHLASQDEGGFEPQRVNNFAVQFDGLPSPADRDDIIMSLVSAFIPVVGNEDIPLPYGNEVVYVAGRAIPEGGQLVVRDFVDRTIAAGFLAWRNKVYDPSSGRIGLSSDYKKTAHVLLFGPNSRDDAPESQRQWDVYGIWPTRVNFAGGGLSMEGSGVVQIAVDLRFDKVLPGFGLANTGASDTAT